jgi:hypothetical protein
MMQETTVEMETTEDDFLSRSSAIKVVFTGILVRAGCCMLMSCKKLLSRTLVLLKHFLSHFNHNLLMIQHSATDLKACSPLACVQFLVQFHVFLAIGRLLMNIYRAAK